MRACLPLASYLGTGRAGPRSHSGHPVTTYIRVGSVPRSRRLFFFHDAFKSQPPGPAHQPGGTHGVFHYIRSAVRRVRAPPPPPLIARLFLLTRTARSKPHLTKKQLSVPALGILNHIGFHLISMPKKRAGRVATPRDPQANHRQMPSTSIEEGLGLSHFGGTVTSSINPYDLEPCPISIAAVPNRGGGVRRWGLSTRHSA
ncbi:hypothetical protein CDEST_03270 [Colletotrichum destructivum]|uniref:Uncharacterized protein n=1 Tax=Colletotrichum destructivum TaxID=34406 RepID=A0AAX4I4V6_9PEZI|nr:hypothetical protein CDEST_03270 [Colletotrichum destructivum]